jgi:hypothetical protein
MAAKMATKDPGLPSNSSATPRGKPQNGGAWWCTPVIPAFRRFRQEDHELEASPGYTGDPVSKKKQSKKVQNGIVSQPLSKAVNFRDSHTY